MVQGPRDCRSNMRRTPDHIPDHGSEEVAMSEPGSACDAPEAGRPCPECGGQVGHTIRCSQGPGPAEAPSAQELWEVVACLEFPEVEIRLPDRGPVQVPGSRLAWRAFIEWACRRSEAAVAVFEALETFERTWRAEAPTVPPEAVEA